MYRKWRWCSSCSSHQITGLETGKVALEGVTPIATTQATALAQQPTFSTPFVR